MVEVALFIRCPIRFVYLCRIITHEYEIGEYDVDIFPM